MTSPCNDDNKVDFLSSLCKDTFSPSCNNKEPEDTSLLLVPSLSSPMSNNHSNKRSKENFCFIEYNINPLPFSHEHQFVHDDRHKLEKSQLRFPPPYPYPQQQSDEPSKKKAVIQNKQQLTNSSSSVRSNNKKRATYTSDINNVDDNNKEGIEKKRRRKSQGQQEDDNEENKMPKTGRPRWTREERYLLLKAILDEKKLEHVRTFHWECISQQIGKKKKTCKDQWRLELVPSFLDMFSETIGTNEPSYSEQEENISDDSDDDTDECLNEMYSDIPNENEHDNDNK